jgi:hypothetical protein
MTDTTDPQGDQTALRDRIAAAIWERQNPGRRWADCEYRWRADAEADADAVLAVLPATADRAAGPAALREAAAIYESVLQQSLDPDSDPRYCTAVRDVVMGLRRRADEAQQDAPWLSDSARIGRTLIWTWADIGKGVYGQGYRAAQTEARALLTGQRDSDEAQQPETQADAHPPTVTWEIESPRRGTWASWGTTYDEHDWARERFEDAIGHVPARQFRLVRATTVYAVEAEHQPAAVSQPGKEA